MSATFGDNTTIEVGTWSTDGPGFYYGTTTRWKAAGAGTANAGYKFTGLTPGNYRVAITWGADSAGWAIDTPCEIVDSDDTTVLSSEDTNQQKIPNDFADGNWTWKDLGIVTITGTALTIRVTDGASGAVQFDGARIQPASEAPPLDIIVGTHNVGFSMVGAWTDSGAIGGWQGNYRYIAAGSGTNKTLYEIPVEAGESYLLGASWLADPAWATNTPYRILDSDGTTPLATGTINQTVAPSGITSNSRNFLPLNSGATVVPSGATLYVEFTDNANALVASDCVIAQLQFAALTSGVLTVTGFDATSVDTAIGAATGGTGSYSYQWQKAPDVAGSPGTYVDDGVPQGTLTKHHSGLTTGVPLWWKVVTDDGENTVESNEVTETPEDVINPTGIVEWVFDVTTAFTSGEFGGDYLLANAYDDDISTAFSTTASTNGTIGIDLGVGNAAELTAVLLTPIINFEYRSTLYSVEWGDTTGGTFTSVATTPATWPFREPLNRIEVSTGVSKRCWQLKKTTDYCQLTELRFEGTWTSGINWKPARPIFTPGAGRFDAGKIVGLASGTTNANIYITVNEGSLPADPENTDTLSDGTYEVPAITSGETLYVKAIAELNGIYSGVTIAYFNPKEIVTDIGIPAWGGTLNRAQDWRDSKGFLMQAHGGEVFFDRDTFKTYWIGAYMTINDACGIWTYSSDDFGYNWDFLHQTLPYTGVATSAFSSQTRYHHIHNENPIDPNKKHVIICHGITSFSEHYSLVAYGPTLASAFTWLHHVQPIVSGSPVEVLDAALYLEDDGKWYNVAVSGAFATITAWELDPATDNTTYTNVGVVLLTGGREAPLVFRLGSTRYLTHSALMGYNVAGPGDVKIRSASTLAGLNAASDIVLWSSTPATTDVEYVLQPTGVFVPKGYTTPVLVFDSWNPGEGPSDDKYHARAVWYPFDTAPDIDTPSVWTYADSLDEITYTIDIGVTLNTVTGVIAATFLAGINAAIVVAHSGATGALSLTTAAPTFNSNVAASHSGAIGAITASLTVIGAFDFTIIALHSGATLSASGTTTLPSFSSGIAVAHNGPTAAANFSFTSLGEFGFDITATFPSAVFVGDVEVEFPANYVDTIYSDVCFDYIISEAEIIV